MPTAAKLAAALAFAMVGFFAAETYRAELPEGIAGGTFALIVAAIGVLCGWLVMGPAAGRGYRAAAGTGVRTAFTTAFFALLLFSIERMIRKALQRQYGDSPMEAVVDVFSLMLQHGRLILTPEVLVALVAGGALGGLAAEWAGRRWR